MSAGELDQRVTFKRNDPESDGAGGFTDVWTEYATVWASVKPLRGREQQASERQEATRDYVVKIRYRADIQEADKIVWRNRELNVRLLRDAGPRPLYLFVEAELGAAS